MVRFITIYYNFYFKYIINFYQLIINCIHQMNMLSFTTELFLKMWLLMRWFNVVIERVVNDEIYCHLNMMYIDHVLSYYQLIINDVH